MTVEEKVDLQFAVQDFIEAERRANNAEESRKQASLILSEKLGKEPRQFVCRINYKYYLVKVNVDGLRQVEEVELL